MSSKEEHTESFQFFSDMLTGYRTTMVLLTAAESGIFSVLVERGCTAAELCSLAGWQRDFGERFLRCLCGLDILLYDGELYVLSGFGQYLQNHLGTLLFERRLVRSWQQLPQVLRDGCRVWPTDQKSESEVLCDTRNYLKAMDEAATVRSRELWKCFTPSQDSGTLLDVGAGSGRYLEIFLLRHSGWKGIFCDLPHVVADHQIHGCLQEVSGRIQWCATNILADEPSDFDHIPNKSADLVLLSNLLHCQGTTETESLLSKVTAKVSAEGLLLLHDFWTDNEKNGPLYDLHMMVNTYNGRTYLVNEIEHMLADCGFFLQTSHTLSSGSALLLCTRRQAQGR